MCRQIKHVQFGSGFRGLFKYLDKYVAGKVDKCTGSIIVRPSKSGVIPHNKWSHQKRSSPSANLSR